MTRALTAPLQRAEILPLRRLTSSLSARRAQVAAYPDLRYMGSKSRLLPWIFEALNLVDFESALDPFSGTGCVAYLLKAMGRRVVASDFLNFTTTIARATVENNRVHLDGKAIKRLLDRAPPAHRFIENTFAGVFYSREDL